jgi:hypothetical protein
VGNTLEKQAGTANEDQTIPVGLAANERAGQQDMYRRYLEDASSWPAADRQERRMEWV